MYAHMDNGLIFQFPSEQHMKYHSDPVLESRPKCFRMVYNLLLSDQIEGVQDNLILQNLGAKLLSKL